MNLYLLSGESLRNKDWIQEVSAVMSPLFDQTKTHLYRHWQTGQQNTDVDYELEVIKSEVAKMDNYVVFAKSIGSFLTVMSMTRGDIKTPKCLFTGVALNFFKEEYPDWGGRLKAAESKFLIVQNSQDPAGHFAELAEYLGRPTGQNYRMVEWPGDTHSYDYLKELKALMEQFLAE